MELIFRLHGQMSNDSADLAMPNDFKMLRNRLGTPRSRCSQGGNAYFIYVPVKRCNGGCGGFLRFFFLDFFKKFMDIFLRGGATCKDFSYSLHLFEDKSLLLVNAERKSRLHAALPLCIHQQEAFVLE